MRRLCSIARLTRTPFITFVVACGLLIIPVECSLAAGPHSIFVDAGDVASLQAGSAGGSHAHHTMPPPNDIGAAHAAEPDAIHQSAMEPSDTAATPAHHAGSATSENDNPASTQAASPSTAGFASDSIVALLFPDIDPSAIAWEPLLLALSDLSIPPDHLLMGPEPPPP